MQENEFEDELGKNMEGFGIEPSANVWTEVERRIRKEKKRRLAFWLWFLLLLLGGSFATAILFNSENKNKIAATQTEKNINNPIPTPVKKDISTIKGNATDVEIIRKEIQNKKENIVDVLKPVTDKTNSISNKNSTASKLKNTSYKKNEPVKSTSTNKIETQKEKNQTANNINPITAKQPEAATTSVKIMEEKSIFSNLGNKTNTEAVDKKNNTQNFKIADSITNDLAKSDSISNPTKKENENQKLKKWKWGMQFSAGKSGFSNSLFSLNKALNADLSYSSPGSGSSTVGAPSPSAIMPSLALSAGLFIKKPISKKLDISIGLNYNYLSTHRSIGSRVDSTRTVNNNSPNKALVTEFYRPATVGNSKNYSNQFHFIGLQAAIAWKIIAAKKFKLYWENGIAYNRLLSSNMLHYSSSLPGYYKDNSLLNKNQLLFSTGLLLPIGDRFKLKPFLNYNLTKVFKNYATSNPHYSTFGLQLKYILKK